MSTYIDQCTPCLLQKIFKRLVILVLDDSLKLVRMQAESEQVLTTYHFLSSKIRFFKAKSWEFIIEILFC